MDNKNWTPGELPVGFDWEELYRGFIRSRSVYKEYQRRKRLQSKAKRILEEYEKMTKEEKEKERANRKVNDNAFSIPQLQQIVEEDINLPEGYKTSQVQPVSAAEYKKIAQVLFETFNPTDDKPNFSKSKRTLDEEYDIQVSNATLKKHWESIQEQNAFEPLKRAIAWQVLDKGQMTLDLLFQHVIRRIVDEDEGGEWDSIGERVHAVKELYDMLKNSPKDQPKQHEVKKKTQEISRVEFGAYSEEQEEKIKEGETIDVEGEEVNDS